MNYPSTRAEAMAIGAKYYFTGVPCKHGHICLRKTKGNCIECSRDEAHALNEKRKGQPKSEAAKAAGRRYYERNITLTKLRAKGIPKEKSREYKRKWREANKERSRINVNTRRRRLREASPPWLTQAHKAAIQAVYIQAAELTRQTGIRYTVDHIIPLKGETVCGLHVPWNLQTIRHTANARKSNKHA